MMIQDLCEAFVQHHGDDAARALERKDPASVATLLAELAPHVVAELFRWLDPLRARAILEQLPTETTTHLLQQLETHHATAILRRIPPSARDPILLLLPPDRSQPLTLLLRYPEHTVGATMDPAYPCLPIDLSLSEALDRVRAGADRTSLYWFTVNRTQAVTGVVSIRDLLSQDSDRRVQDVQQPCSHRLSALTDVSTIRDEEELKRLGALPVTDEKGIYLGAVRHESTLNVNETEPITADSVQVAGSALGELYRLGLFGIVYSLDPTSGETSASKEVRS